MAMRRNRTVFACSQAVIAGLAAAIILSGSALAQVTESSVRAMLTDEYGVEVLEIRAVDTADGPVYEAVVMNPGGDSNAAFQVGVVRIDAQSGKLVPQVSHGPSGYETGGAATLGIPEGSGPTLRRESFGGR